MQIFAHRMPQKGRNTFLVCWGTEKKRKRKRACVRLIVHINPCRNHPLSQHNISILPTEDIVRMNLNWLISIELQLRCQWSCWHHGTVTINRTGRSRETAALAQEEPHDGAAASAPTTASTSSATARTRASTVADDHNHGRSNDHDHPQRSSDRIIQSSHAHGPAGATLQSQVLLLLLLTLLLELLLLLRLLRLLLILIGMQMSYLETSSFDKQWYRLKQLFMTFSICKWATLRHAELYNNNSIDIELGGTISRRRSCPASVIWGTRRTSSTWLWPATASLSPPTRWSSPPAVLTSDTYSRSATFFRILICITPSSYANHFPYQANSTGSYYYLHYYLDHYLDYYLITTLLSSQPLLKSTITATIRLNNFWFFRAN